MLAAANRAIGESSNLAQIAQTYCNNFPDEKYYDYVCILAVLAQIAIDNAKRSYDVDLTSEIKRIKNDLDIDRNGYPLFWSIIKKDFDKNKINYSLECPMNYLSKVKFKKIRSKDSTLPMKYFFINHKLDSDKRKCRKVENLIEQYSLDIYNSRMQDNDNYLLLREDFDNLIEDIRSVYISKNYQGLMSWLINRAFIITSGVKSKRKEMDSVLNKNKPLLLKTLYTINNDVFLNCFVKGDKNP